MSELKRIDAIARIRRGASPRPIEDSRYFGGDVGWVRIIDVTRSSRFLRRTEQYLSPLGESLSVRVKPGDLIMSICGTIGRPIMIDMQACIHDGFVQLFDLVGADASFLYYALQHAEPAFRAMGQPGTQTNLNTLLVGRHAIFCPAESEQRRIANILSTVDETTEQTEALIAKYQQIKAGLMQDLFTRGITPDGHLRPTRAQAPQIYKESPFGWVPKEWNLGRLADYIGAIDSGWSPNCETRPAGPDEWGVLKTTAVVWEGYRPSENKALPEGSSLLRSIEVRTGDILITRKGPVDRVGVVAFVQETPPRLIFPDTVFRTKLLSSGAYLAPFLARALGSRAVQKFWWQRKVGLADAQVNLNHGILRATPVMVPSIREQEAILIRLGQVDEVVETSSLLASKLRAQKHGLMHDLLTGRVRVKATQSEEGPA